MSKIAFIIAEKSYLIRKGLISIIEKIPNTQVLHIFDNAEDFNFLNNYEFDFLIACPELLNSISKKLIDKIPKKSQIIVLKDKPAHLKNIKNSETIYLDDTQNCILRKLNHLIGNKENSSKKTSFPDEISSREADILKNIALGFSNKEIADKLFISTHTVITHRKNITRKLGIKTVPGLTIYAILNKLIDINDTE